MILDLFVSRPDHPLSDAKELRRTLDALPTENAFKAVDEIYGWFESLRHAEGFRAAQLFNVVRQLDDVGSYKVRRLTRDYLYSHRLSKSEERRLWTMCFNYWGEVASLYAQCIELAEASPKDRVTEAMKSVMPLLWARQVAARANQQRWMIYRYEVVGEDLWRGLGKAFLRAVAGGHAQKPLQLYPGMSELTSVAQQYLQLLVLSASSMDSLIPLEIELADRLIGHLLPGFVFSDVSQQDSVYWIDAAAGKPPSRLVRQPESLTPNLRFFSPGNAHRTLHDLIRVVERGEVPQDLNLGGEYSAKIVLPVLRHLALYWAPKPPVRAHPRHPVKTRMAVLQGFDDCFTLFSGDVARFGKEQAAESWVVENVSLGGFRASVETTGDWLRVGALLGLQPEGGENWLLGIVRRYNKETEAQASVAIQTLSRVARSVELRPSGSRFSAGGAIPGICLNASEEAGDIQVVLPPASFDVREAVEFVADGRRCLLSPIELVETGNNFEIASYRMTSA